MISSPTFNNHFFEEAARIEQANESNMNGEDAQQIGKAYAQVLQEIPSEKKEEGNVRICLLDSTNYLENTLQQLAATISQLLDKGIAANKMAILVRVNNYIPIIANYLMEQLPDVKLVSDEAFSLDASVGVNILIMALRLLAHPDDILTKASLVKYYQRNVLESTSTDAELFEQTDNLDNLLPHEFVSNSLQLRIKPLYELCEDLNSMFQLSKMTNESAYLCTFFDVLSAFTQETSADIDAFLNEWEEDYHKQNIQSDEIDGIRMISIHKSKGLEFDNLLIPFCDWQLEKTRDNILWCEPTEEGFDRLPLAPIDYSAKLLESIYDADYREEHLQNTVDNLNLLYVAFTRASKNLFVWGLNNGSSRRSNIISTILPNLQKQLTNATLTSSEKCPMLFEYGELLVESHSEKKENTTDNVFLKPISTEHITVETFASHAEFRQSNKSREFVAVTDDDEQSKQQSYIKTGNILHKLFSAIQTADDIDEALRQLEFEGILNEGGISSDSLRKMLHKRLSHPLVAEWFSPKWTLFNECTILDFNPTTHTACERRPDRVMTDGEQMIVVDFKFGKPNNEYRQQVAEYMQLLAQMGYHNIKGYLWYVYTNTIEEVK